jgi:hypothetical protein
MAIYRGASIVSQGITLCLDGANPNSIVAGSTSWYDVSGNNNIATLSGASIPTYKSSSGGSVTFAGLASPASIGTIPHSNTYAPSGSNATMEAWVKFNYLDYTTSSGSLMRFIRKGTPDQAGAGNGFFFGYDNRGNDSSFLYTCFGNSAGGFSGGNNNFGDTAYDTVFTTGSWNHIVAVIANSTGSLYINGVQKGPSKIFTGLTLYDNATSGILGAANNGVAGFGSQYELGNLKLYNRALSATEVLQNYNAYQYRFNL